jgi:hypothetical protein
LLHGAKGCLHNSICRGYFNVNATADSYGNLPDTYINVGKGGWAKGVAFINGFNLVCFFAPKSTCSSSALWLHAKNNSAAASLLPLPWDGLDSMHLY